MKFTTAEAKELLEDKNISFMTNGVRETRNGMLFNWCVYAPGGKYLGIFEAPPKVGEELGLEFDEEAVVG